MAIAKEGPCEGYSTRILPLLEQVQGIDNICTEATLVYEEFLKFILAPDTYLTPPHSMRYKLLKLVAGYAMPPCEVLEEEESVIDNAEGSDREAPLTTVPTGARGRCPLSMA
jgi:hypothetical protein